MSEEAVKSLKFNKLNMKANNLDNIIPDATVVIHINQYNTDKQNSEKKVGDVESKIPDNGGLMIARLTV